METWVAPAAALLGVVLGGLINIGASVIAEGRRDRAQDRRDRIGTTHELQDACARLVDVVIELDAVEQVRSEYPGDERELEMHRNKLLAELASAGVLAKKLAARIGEPEIIRIVREFVASSTEVLADQPAGAEADRFPLRSFVDQFDRLLVDVAALAQSAR